MTSVRVKALRTRDLPEGKRITKVGQSRVLLTLLCVFQVQKEVSWGILSPGRQSKEACNVGFGLDETLNAQ
jgi:hypothetical protein